MKAITPEWLDRAGDDLRIAELLLTQPELTNMVAFHAQQSVEKALKAVLEESSIAPVRTHSLTRLYGLVESRLPFDVDQDMLDRLDAVYIESRYPGEMGLLPHGKPALADAKGFYHFARQFYGRVQTEMDTNNEEDTHAGEKTQVRFFEACGRKDSRDDLVWHATLKDPASTGLRVCVSTK
jgi:HEPN domain-containing protein